MQSEYLLDETFLVCLNEKTKMLGGQAVNLFKTALKTTRSHLVESYFLPALCNRPHSYLYLATDKETGHRKNWNPGNTLDAQYFLATHPGASLERWGVFTNPLAWIEPGVEQPKPKDRAFNAGFTVCTFEFDGIPLRDQIEMVCDGSLKNLDENFQDLKDYRGYEVVWGGGKSVHFHYVFDLRHLKHDLASANNSSYQDNWTQDVPDKYLRVFHRKIWAFLARHFSDAVGVQVDDLDPNLQFWEQPRRTPLARRVVEAHHPLGLPEGYYVRQLVLASNIRTKMISGASVWGHNPRLLPELVDEFTKSRASDANAIDLGSVTMADRQKFDAWAREKFRFLIGQAYPAYARCEFNAGGVTCFFSNSPSDIHPSSFCQGDRDSILARGRHGLLPDVIPLGTTPNKLFRAMLDHESAPSAATSDPLMRAFNDTVHDRASYRDFLASHIVEASTAAPVVMILGPAGCGKTTAVFSNIEKLHEEDPELPILISSPSYEQAMEKMKTFYDLHPNEPFVPYMYFSLTKLYEQFCLKEQRISATDAFERGHSGWLRAVHDEQPEVYERMRAHRDKLGALRDRGLIPVLFTVHETIRKHVARGMTRLFYAPSFNEQWFEKMPPEERQALRARLIYENEFGHVFLDEVSQQDLVSIHAEDEVDWAKACEEEISEIPQQDAAARYQAFKSYWYEHQKPGMNWTRFQEIIHARYEADDHVVVPQCSLPFDDEEGIYAARIGTTFYTRALSWWKHLPRTTFLTTELLPASIIEALDREADPADLGGSQEPQYRVFRFDHPDLLPDIVDLEIQRSCNKKGLVGLADAYRHSYPGAVIVSDMLKDRWEEVGVITHQSARGSNDLTGDIVALYTAPSPDLFAKLAAIDARLGTRDSMKLFYLDRYNQTCGRNRGFRNNNDSSHIVVMGRRMYRWLISELINSRYTPAHRRSSILEI